MEDLLLSSLTIKSSIRSYEVFFNQSLIISLENELDNKDYILIDKNVFNHMHSDVKNFIIRFKYLLIDATEENKSYTALKPVIENLIKDKFRRTNRLVAIGGGITQDICAFIASILYRGVKWIFYPTTLLAQADSCIGGKTSINIGEFKNQLGNFYPPEKIFIIPEFLRSLSNLDFKSGMGEMLHFYLVSSEEDFAFYQRFYNKAFSDEKVLLQLVKRNLEIKKDFIEKDEFDQGERLLLNYGHSFGHAIESLTNYAVPHGIAVSYGMDIANFVSVKLGFITNNIRLKCRNQLEKIWDGTSLGKINVREFENMLSRDKKNTTNTYQLILTKGLGKMLMYGITPSSTFTSWMEEYFNSNNSLK